MNHTTVLYVEDSESQRMALKMALEQRGFHVETAGDVKTARAQIEKLGEELDVLVLDMRLEDPDFPQLTGADVALEYFNPRTEWPPEFLIQSAYTEVDYYRLALKLGAAVYLSKAEFRQEQVIRHIRALAIRRILSAKRKRVADQLRKIVERSQGPLEAISIFCREVLLESFRNRLGTPFILLLTFERKTLCIPSDIELPQQSGIYETLQAMAFAEVRRSKPFILTSAETAKIYIQCNAEEKTILAKLLDAAFLPLSINRDLSLSLVVLQDTSDKITLAENPKEMAYVLAQYFESAVLELFLGILTYWTEYEARREELRRATSMICLNTGQEWQSILRTVDVLNEPLAGSDAFIQLSSLANDLLATGSLLNALGKDKGGSEDLSELALQPMAQFVRTVWDDFNDGVNNVTLEITPETDCHVQADEDDLLIVISRVLQWCVQRLDYTPAGIKPSILVTCSEVDGAPRLVFEDRSRRLDKALRKRLFEPFAETVMTVTQGKKLEGKPGLYLPLYLAKMLVEVNYKGWLEDQSDGLPDLVDEEGKPVGHRFVMTFRKPEA